MELLAQRRICENCGSSLDLEMPSGFCPGCLLNTVLQTESDTASGNRIEDYGLLNEIARGGMGIVYRARQRVPSRTVALKMILPAHLNSPGAVSRFRMEAEAAASLDHDGILPIYAVGEHDGAPFYSMKLAEGGTLSARIDNYRDKLRDAAALIAKLARAVAFAHEHGILHRDLKPGNVLFDSAGKPYVSDFGLAKWLQRECDLTQTLAILGTPYYMAPEQATDSRGVTASADVYSLGAILYHLLTGRPPFAGDTPMEVLHRVEKESPKPPRLTNQHVPRDLETICLKCLAKEPATRYASATALAEDLERWLKHQPIQAKRSGFVTQGRKWVRRNPTTASLATALVTLAAAAGVMIWKTEFPQYRVATSGIAVLPFENLSDDKENAYFAEGVQEEILNDLAKVADLKVISRASVIVYKAGSARNLREIGQQLGVAHVLEGSVQRAGAKVRVSAQLIDARIDKQIWAGTYDRELADVFSIETELAQAIAGELQVKLTTSEKAAIEEKPTQDLAAYDFYVHALSIIYTAQVPTSADLVNLSEAVDLLDKAVARDPNFFLAYYQLAFAHDLIYQEEKDHTPARLALAKSAIDSALRLRPDSGEAHLALAWHLYWGNSEYNRARAEAALAQQSLPNNAQVFELAGLIDRRERHWADAIHNLERAGELDPRNLPYHITLATTYLWLHDYDQEARVLDRIIALHPERRLPRILRPGIEIDRRADTRPCHAAIKKILTTEPGSEKDPDVTSWRFDLALSDRDLETAASIAAALPLKQTLYTSFNQGSRDFWLGVVARLKGDVAAARAAFVRARTETEEELRVHPDDIGLLSDLGLIDAALGRKQEALSEGRRAMELAPTVQEAMTGWSNNEGSAARSFAVICAQVGETDLALEQLEAITKVPGGPTYGNLRLDPDWDALRGNPRFEKIVQSLAPKDANRKIASNAH